MRGVLGEHRRGDGAAALQLSERLACNKGLATQDAVLIGKAQANGFEILLVDDAANAVRRIFLLGAPEAVTLNEGHGVASLAVRRNDRVMSSFRDGAQAPDPESRDSLMCNCTS